MKRLQNPVIPHQHTAGKSRNGDNPEVDPVNCYVCDKQTPGAYGWTDLHMVGVVASCSGKCEREIAQLREKRYDGFL